MKIKRVNLYAGPSGGKSTTSALLFGKLKQLGYNVELTGEYIKNWAYSHRKVNKWDQVYVFGKQHQYEYRYLANGVDFIVTDSPIFLSYVYSQHYGHDEFCGPLLELAKAYEKEFPSLNIILDRGSKPYNTLGRWQTQEQARELDTTIENHVRANFNNVHKVPTGDVDGIIRLLQEYEEHENGE